MSMGTGGGGSTTTTQKADPWGPLQGPLNTLYQSAIKNYNSGGPQYYPNQTFAGSNWDIENALNSGSRRAMSDPYAGMLDQAQGSLGATAAGRSPYENPGYPVTNAYAQGQVVGANPAQAGTQALSDPSGTFGKFASGGYAGTNPAQGYFRDATSGGYLNSNPYIDQMVQSAQRPVIDNFQRAIAPSLASQFSMAGRTGSGAHTAAFGTAADSLGRQLGDISTNIYGTTYENERNRQQAAATQLANMSEAEKAQMLQGAQGQLSALGQLSGQNQFDRTQQMRGAEDLTGAYQNERGLQQNASLAAPGFAQARTGMDYDAIAKLLGVGQYRQGQEQQGIDADKARFDYGQQLPGMNLQMLNQILQGGMSLNGSTTSGKSGLDRNPFNSGLGGAAMGASIGNIFPGIGTALGAGIGGIGGLLFG